MTLEEFIVETKKYEAQFLRCEWRHSKVADDSERLMFGVLVLGKDGVVHGANQMIAPSSSGHGWGIERAQDYALRSLLAKLEDLYAPESVESISSP